MDTKLVAKDRKSGALVDACQQVKESFELLLVDCLGVDLDQLKAFLLGNSGDYCNVACPICFDVHFDILVGP